MLQLWFRHPELYNKHHAGEEEGGGGRRREEKREEKKGEEGGEGGRRGRRRREKKCNHSRTIERKTRFVGGEGGWGKEAEEDESANVKVCSRSRRDFWEE